MDDGQWIRLINLIHSYKNPGLLSISETLRKENNPLNFINQSMLQNLLHCFYQTVGNILCSNSNILHLSSDDRAILLHTAAANTICMAGQLIHYHDRSINHELLWKYLEQIYGRIILDYRRISSKFVEPDMIVCKLAIPLFTLSTNARIFSRNIDGEYRNIKQILSIQDKYAELIWKYLIRQYTYREAIKKYTRIIQWFLLLTTFMQDAYNVDRYVHDVESLVEQMELTLLSEDIDAIVDNNI